MTNARDGVGIPREFGSDINFLSYGIIPFKYFDGLFYKRTRKGNQGILAVGEGLTLTEFGYVPITHDITREMSELELTENLKF